MRTPLRMRCPLGLVCSTERTRPQRELCPLLPEKSVCHHEENKFIRHGTFGLTIPRMEDCEANFLLSSLPARGGAMPTEGRATPRVRGAVNSTARLVRRPQHVVPWRMEGRTPLPIFCQTKRTIPFRGGGRRRFPENNLKATHSPNQGLGRVRCSPSC